MTPTVTALSLVLLLFSLQLMASYQTQTPTLASTTPPDASSLRTNITHILQDVLKEICARERWDLSGVRVSKLDLGKARYANAQRFEFRIGFGKTDLFLRFSDEVMAWRRLRGAGESSFGDTLRQVSSETQIGSFKIQGPFELRANGEHEFTLSLPLNTTYTGLRRVFVREGITVEVNGAREVSLLYARHFNSSNNISQVKSGFWPNWQALCIPVLPIRVSGSASLLAFRTRNPSAYIETNLPSSDTIDLLPEKCYGNFRYKKPSCPIDSLSSRVEALERVVRGLMGDRMRQSGILGSVKAKVKAVTVIRVQIQLERDVKGNETHLVKLEDWRTRPTVERVWFEVVGRVDMETFKPLEVKRVRPFLGADTVAWSSLLSNISFTKFPSVLVPPEALTLDVKW